MSKRPSYDELAALVVSRAKRIAELETEVAELKQRLGRNSRNSSSPPSADSPFDKPPARQRSLRRQSGRKPGGQPGHPGVTLEQVAAPDEVLRHEPAVCGGCGAGLSGAREGGIDRRQVFDLPPIRIRVTEHQLVWRRCGCGTETCGDAPTGVTAPTQYGPRVTAIVLYLYFGQFLSKKRTAQALAELFGAPLLHGTVSTMSRRATTGLHGFLDMVRGAITRAPVAHFDETGFRVDARVQWVHSASTPGCTLLHVDGKRGREAMDNAGVLPGFTGIAVHDMFAPYDAYPAMTHALCNAHLLRELQAVTDDTPTDAWCWATQIADALRTLNTAINAGAITITADVLAEQTRLIRSAAAIGIRGNAQRASAIMLKHHNLARRIRDRLSDYLPFTTDFRVPFDNNPAEQEIRMVKLRQKVSYCARTLTGARQFAAIRSYLSTATKHGITFYDALTQLAEGQPRLPTTP